MKTKGFAAIETILIVIIIGALVAVGYFVYQRQNSDTTDDSYTYGSTASESEESTEISEITITNVDVTGIIFKDDVSKLPEIAPESFKDFLTSTLPSKENFDSSQCQSSFSVSKISSVNILGGVGDVAVKPDGTVDTESNNCGAGGYVIWGINSDGNWAKGTGGHDSPECATLEDPKIYSEFAEECFTDVSTGAKIQNPNGSINDANL